jgi:hypothetical protein
LESTTSHDLVSVGAVTEGLTGSHRQQKQSRKASKQPRTQQTVTQHGPPEKVLLGVHQPETSESLEPDGYQ